jgi:hypothetical protein
MATKAQNKYEKAHQEVIAHLTSSATLAPSGWLLFLFESVMLPILGQLLLLLKPKIQANPKLMQALTFADQVIDDILGEP